MKVGCYDCGLEYTGPGWIEAVIPDYVWSLIKPEEGAGLLCITCICKRLNKIGLDNVPCFICGTEPINVLVNPDNRIREYILRNWKPDRS